MKRWMMGLCVLLIWMAAGMACCETADTAATAEPAAVELKYGDKSDAVLELQTRLKELGYYNGPLSGQFAEVTRSAVKELQADFGLEQTGVADASTLSVLAQVKYRPLEYGDSGEGVKTLQKALKEYKLYEDEISGKYLKNTRSAVAAFQQLAGLESTGKADETTLEMLYSKVVPLPTPTPTPEPTPTPTPTPTPDITFRGTLSYGDTGARVTLLQERLLELGFYEGKLTTGFYQRTRDAVEAFQRHNALKVDGIVGEETWNALFAQSAVPASATAAPPTPVPYFVEVDVVNQVTKVFTRDENGEFTVLHKAFICSTGTVGYPSDPGLWTLSGRRALWANFPKWGGGTAQYWTKINNNIAFHSVIYLSLIHI